MQVGVAPRIVLLLGLSVLVAAPAPAVQIGIDLFDDGALVTSFDEVSANCAPTATPGLTGCSVSNVLIGDIEILSLNLQLFENVTAGPLTGLYGISANIGFENQGAVTQQLTMAVTLDIAGLGPFTLTNGSVAGTLGDGLTGPSTPDGNATIAAPNGGALYSALIDAIVYQQLHEDPFSQSTASTQSVSFPTDSFSTPGPPTQPGPGVVNNVGLVYDFTLTAGDRGTVNGAFRLVAVPEPGTAALLGIGLAVLARVGRRR